MSRRRLLVVSLLGFTLPTAFALLIPGGMLGAQEMAAPAAEAKVDAAAPATEAHVDAAADTQVAPVPATPDADVEPTAPAAEEPIDVAATVQHADALIALGDLAGAETELRRALGQEPQNAYALARLRRVLIDSHKTSELPDVLASLTEARFKDGQRDLADSRLDELITLAPDYPKRKELEVMLGRVENNQQRHGSLLDRLRGLIGIAAILGIAFLMSNNRKKVRWRVVGWGLGLQLIFAITILWTPVGRRVFEGARFAVEKLLSFTDYGAGFLFGSLYNGLAAQGGHGPMKIVDGTSGDFVNIGIVFAFHILPTIIFFGSLMSVLYHFGVIQKVVRGIAWVMTRTMGTSGAESLSAASNIFVGQTEAPLVIKPYVDDMTMSELMAIMTGGFATVAGGVMAAYVRFGIDAGHLLAASVMAAPGGLMLAKIIYPETHVPRTQGGAVHDPERATANIIDAAAAGAGDGLKLALNVAAMLMAFIALIALVNSALGLFGLSLAQIFGWIFYPLSWAMGVDTKDLLAFGNLIGTKLSLNEFVAYVELGHLRSTLNPRTFTIATYALCGFANFSSIGIQIGGISGIAPMRRSDLARVGLKAMIAGALATALTGTIAGILIS